MDHPQIWGLNQWRPLADGGVAVVWQAEQSMLARRVAVKVYRQALAVDGGAFAREASVIGGLDHPGLVTAYNAGVLPDDRPYLMLELCPGGSLDPRLDPERRLTGEQVRSIGIRIADALAAVHACGFVHRDVRPANILLDGCGDPRLVDFGSALEIGATPDAAGPPRLALAYAPPEVSERGPASEAGDVFSLAATLYALLAARAPRPVSPTMSLDQLRQAAARPVEPLPSAPLLMAALATALSPDPAARPTAAALRDRLVAARSAGSPRRALPALDDDHPPLVPLVPVAAPGEGAPDGPEAVDGGRAAAEAQPPMPAPVAVAAAPRRRWTRRVGVLAVAATLVGVAVTGMVWRNAGPASSGAPAAITRAQGPGGSSAGGASAPSTAAGGQTRPSAVAVGPASAPATSPAATSPTATSPAATSPATKGVQIRLEDTAHSAEPFQTVALRGTFAGGAGAFVQVQRWEGGRWMSFPVPATTDESGGFTAYVELGQPGDHRLRVVDPQSGAASEPFALVIRRS